MREMCSFDKQLSFDAVNTFLVEFGEWIEFLPWQDAPVRIRAIIDRDPSMGIKGLTGSASFKHEVQIARDCTAGRIAIVKGKDVMKYPLRVRGEIRRFTVLDILGPEDPGMWRLAVGLA